MIEKQFIRLPGRRFGVLRRASLWDGGDYLLSISGTTFSEHYRRFYYRDIKSIVVQQGPRLGSVGALLFTALFSTLLAIAAAVPHAPAFFRWLLLLPLLWLARLIYVNAARSGRVFIFTAVSSEELPALFRRRAAALALPRVLTKIAEAQGTLEGIPRESRLSEPAPYANQKVQPAPLPASRQILYAISLFSILFLASALFAYWYRSAAWTSSALLTAKIALPTLNALEVASGVWALFKLFRVPRMNSLRICVFAGLTLLALRTYSLILLLSLLNQRDSIMSDALSKIQPRFWVGTVDSALSLVLGVAGLISLMLVWQESESPEPPLSTL